jgi:hypothetical protein
VPDGYVTLLAPSDQLRRDRALVRGWEHAVAATQTQTSRVIAATQRALEQRLGRQLTSDEVHDTMRAGQVEMLPPHPLSREARFARGE